MCIDNLRVEGALEKYKRSVDMAISDVMTTNSRFEKLFKEASWLNIDKMSQMMCLVSRKDRGDVQSEAVVWPISQSIQTRTCQ
jgi:hypothetical protein